MLGLHTISSNILPSWHACLCLCVCARDTSYTCWHLKRSINVPLSPVPLQSQAEAHYKGNRHARRVKGIETSKSRPQEGEKPHAAPTAASPSPGGATGSGPESETSKSGERSSAEPNGAEELYFVFFFMIVAISARHRA